MGETHGSKLVHASISVQMSIQQDTAAADEPWSEGTAPTDEEFEFESDNDDLLDDLSTKPDEHDESAAERTLTAFRAETAARARSAGGQAVDSRFAPVQAESASSTNTSGAADTPQKKSRSERDGVIESSSAAAMPSGASDGTAARAGGPRLVTLQSD